MASVDRQRGLDTSEGHRTRECEWYEVPKTKVEYLGRGASLLAGQAGCRAARFIRQVESPMPETSA